MRCEVSLAKKTKKTLKMFEDGFKQLLFFFGGDDLDWDLFPKGVAYFSCGLGCLNVGDIERP